MGHISDFALSHLPLGLKPKCRSCDICHKAKQPKNSFSKSSSHSKNLFNLVHMDIWGPSKLPTQSGCHYFLIILDNHSRSVWTFLLPNKSNLTKIIENFAVKIKNQFHYH